jgi:hypothetical protein
VIPARDGPGTGLIGSFYPADRAGRGARGTVATRSTTLREASLALRAAFGVVGSMTGKRLGELDELVDDLALPPVKLDAGGASIIGVEDFLLGLSSFRSSRS